MTGHEIVPTSYEQWRECIEVRCRIPLTPKFIGECLAELQDLENPHTKRFEKLYGTDHLQRTVSWSRRAADERSV